MECDFCGEEFQRIGQHWGYNPNHQPNITEKQYEILTGIVMSDGSVKRDNNRNPYIRVRSVTKEYLEYLDNIFGNMSLGVNLRYTAEEKAELNRQSGFQNDANKDNYSDQYLWKTRRSSQFERFSDWYDSGEKVWPEVKLTSTIIKHLYVCDGHYNNKQSNNYISIACSNEWDNRDKIEKMFSNSGYDISYWSESSPTKNTGSRGLRMNFDVETTKQLFKDMGDPIPGFEYKWPDQNS